MYCDNCKNKLVKNGKTISGSQKYLCKICGFRCTPIKKRYSDIFKSKVVDKYLSGMSANKVAKEYGIDNKTVVSWSKDSSIFDL